MKEKYFRIAGGLLIILSIIFEIFNIEFYTNLILALGVIVVFLPSIIKKESNGKNKNQRQIKNKKSFLVSILVVFLIALIFSYLFFNK